jgi:hypothetical protein
MCRNRISTYQLLFDFMTHVDFIFTVSVMAKFRPRCSRSPEVWHKSIMFTIDGKYVQASLNAFRKVVSRHVVTVLCVLTARQRPWVAHRQENLCKEYERRKCNYKIRNLVMTSGCQQLAKAIIRVWLAVADKVGMPFVSCYCTTQNYKLDSFQRQ